MIVQTKQVNAAIVTGIDFKTISEMTDPNEQVASYSYYLALSQCINESQFKSSITSNVASDIFAGMSNERRVGIIAEKVAKSIGISVSGDDGIMQCSSVAQAAFKLWGIADADQSIVLTALNYTKQVSYQCVGNYQNTDGSYTLKGVKDAFTLPLSTKELGYDKYGNIKDASTKYGDTIDGIDEATKYCTEVVANTSGVSKAEISIQPLLSDSDVWTLQGSTPTVMALIRDNVYKFTNHNTEPSLNGSADYDIKGLEYYIYMYNFKDPSACGAVSYGPTSELNDSVTNGTKLATYVSGIKDNKMYVEVPIIDAATGTSKDYSFIMTGKTINSASIIPLWVNKTTTCSEIVQKLKDDTPGMVLRMKSGTNYSTILTALGGAGETAAIVPITTDDAKAGTSCAIPGLGWIICPVLTFMSGLADKMLDLFNGFLVTSPSIVSNTSTTYNAWQIVRNIANIAFAIAFLVIIFSQITSVGITNYGIKKMLPRLIIAAILVNVSFYICQIAVDLSNIIGISIKGFLESPSLNPGGAVASGTWSGGTWTNILGTIGVIGIGVAAVSMGALAVLIPALLSAIVALAMILFILIGRQAIIILLVIISPLAFVAYLLPNTEKLFKKWQTTLTSMLLLFPIVAFVAGMSKLAANILTPIFTANPDPTISLVGTIAANAVVVLPLFIIPGLLKKALDGVGSLGTKINALGTKAGSALGKKGGKAYDNTALARGRAIREQAKTSYRNQKFAKSLGKNGPRSFFAKNHIPLSNTSKYANQQLQRTATAESDKADSIAVTSEQALLEADILSGKRTANQAFNDSVKANDAIGAKAALNVKFQTAGGRTETHTLLKDAETATAAGTFKTDNLQSLRRHVSVSQPDMDSKDASIGDWGHNKTYPIGHARAGQAMELSDLETSTDTYKLTDTKLVGQSKNGLVEAYGGGTGPLDHVVAARILANGNITKDLKMPEREYLDRIVAAGGGALAPPPLGVTDTGF